MYRVGNEKNTFFYQLDTLYRVAGEMYCGVHQLDSLHNMTLYRA